MNSDTGVVDNSPAAPTPAAITPTGTAVPVSVTSGVGKEGVPITVNSGETVTSLVSEVEIPPEVKKVGAIGIKDTIELPPDIKKLGVTHAGATVPVTITPPLPQVNLPISDSEVVEGLHTKVGNAIRWLATWCVKKLKKAHIALKVIHGKIIRVKE